MVKIRINGTEYCANEGQTILEVCKQNGIDIPTLCYLKEFGPNSSCRICLVEVIGQRNLVTACSFKVFDGMEILTNTEKVVKSRKTNLELLLSNHNYDCKNCVRNNSCELQLLTEEYNADPNRFSGEKTEVGFVDDSNPCIVRDRSKCILCKKCVLACNQRQQVHAINQNNRGFKTKIGSAFDERLNDSPCVGCGQCILVCPTGALSEKTNITDVENALKDRSKFVVIAPAPSVRVALAEEFEKAPQASVESVIPSICRKMGFDKVYDVNFAADLTICEEGNEFLNRLKQNKNLPLFTSCCPAWVDFAEKNYPELKQNISSCKSPQQMFGAVVKTYLADKLQLDPKNIVVVSIMPCTAKKAEIQRKEMQSGYGKDVDYSLTVREFAYMVKKHNIDIASLQDSKFDELLGESSGAGVIFGSSGGVMEAALRTVADILTGEELGEIDYEAVRGLEGVKTATLTISGKPVNVAVVSGLGNTRKLIEKIKTGEIKADFVEVMSCPGGCINGGGMPRKTASQLNFEADIRESRSKGLYDIDKSRKNRKSHKNEDVIKFYDWQKQSGKKVNLHTRH